MQIHNFPIELLTSKNAEVIGGRLGRLIKVDDLWVVEGVGIGFMSIRLGMQINKLLVEGF